MRYLIIAAMMLCMSCHREPSCFDITLNYKDGSSETLKGVVETRFGGRFFLFDGQEIKVNYDNVTSSRRSAPYNPEGHPQTRH